MKPSLSRKIKQRTNKRVRELPEYVEDYIFENKDSKEPQTLLAYAKDITLFFDYLAYSGFIEDENYADVTIDVLQSLTKRDVQRFLDYLEDYEKTYQTKTGKTVTRTFKNDTYGKARKLAAVRELFEFLTDKGLLNKNVARTIKFKVITRGYIKDRLTNEQIKDLFNAIEDSGKTKKKHAEHVSLRDYTILTILAYSGIRISELVQLDLNDISLHDESMLVLRKGGKKQKIDLSPKIIQQLNVYLPYRETLVAKSREDEQSVFLSMQGKRPNAQTILNSLKKYGEIAGIPFPVTPHVLRRTFGTNVYRQEGDMYLVADMLGHSSAETTRKHYVSIDEDRKKSTIKSFEY